MLLSLGPFRILHLKFFAAGLFLLSSSSLFAQNFTAKDLLENVVESWGPQYDDVEKALENLRSGNVEEGRRLLDVAYQKNPDLPPPNIMLAQIMFRARKAQEGRVALEQAAEKTPNDPAAFIYLGELNLQTSKLTEAASMFRTGIDKCKNYKANNKRKSRLLANAYGGLALIEENKQNWPEAKKYLDELLKHDAENILALTRKGRVMFKMAKNRDDETAAYRVFQDLYKLDPEKTARPEINMAILYDQDGRSSNAENLMKKAVERDGNNVRTRLSVAKWAMDSGNLQLAKENTEAAAKLDPSLLEVTLYRGLVARFEGNFAAAEQAFKDAHYQSPKHLGALTQLAISLLEQDDRKKQELGLQFADLARRVYPDLKKAAGRETGIVFAWALHKLGQANSAASSVAQVYKNGKVSPDNAFFAAQIIFDNGGAKMASEILQDALKNEKAFPNRDKAQQLLQQASN